MTMPPLKRHKPSLFHTPYGALTLATATAFLTLACGKADLPPPPPPAPDAAPSSAPDVPAATPDTAPPPPADGCPTGYAKDPAGACVDIDECATIPSTCHIYRTCTNTDGGFSCAPCPDGFITDGPTDCAHKPPLPSGTVEAGGATQADHQAFRDAWRPELPPDRFELIPQAGVDQTTPEQAAAAIVRPDALVFSAADHPEVRAWETGKLVVSGPSGPGGKNPFGFMRKVASVAEVDGQLVVHTTTPAFEEVFTGELQVAFDFAQARTLEWEELDRTWAAENLYADVGFLGTHYGMPLVDDLPAPEWAPAEPPAGDPWPSWVPGPIQTFGRAVASVGSAVVDTVVDAGKAVGDAAVDVGKAVGSAAIDAGKAVGTAAVQAGKAVAAGVVSVARAILPESLSGDVRLDKRIELGTDSIVIFNKKLSKKWKIKGDLYAEAEFGGKATFGASVAFNPRTSFGIRVPNPIAENPPPFMISLDVDALFEANVNLNVAIEASLKSVGGDPVTDLEKRIADGMELATAAAESFKLEALGDPDTSPADGFKKTLFISKPAMQVVTAGPVPVPIVFTQTFQLDLECGFRAKATLKAELDNTITHSFKFRAEYERGKDPRIGTPIYAKTVTRHLQVEGGGEVVVSCGLIPRINAFIYDMVGVNVGVRASAVARAGFESKCKGKDGTTLKLPQGEIALGLYGNVGVQFGARVQVPGSSYAGKSGQALGADIGPLELWHFQFPIFEGTWEVPGLGVCSPTCTNGRTSKDEPETDLDCGGSCPNGCAADQKCKVNSDCHAGLFCNGGTCGTSHCSDGVRSGDESAIDCGGSCPTKCGLNKPCFVGADCQSGACRRRIGEGVPDELGVCIADTCQDGHKSPGECGIDCGGVCATRCATGVACGDGASCASGASDGHACVGDSCANLKRDANEADLDCGGSCAAKCRVGRSCGAASDCESGACEEAWVADGADKLVADGKVCVGCSLVRKVTAARWSHGDQAADVTRQVAALAAAGKTAFDVRTSTFGVDPAVGLEKRLDVTFVDFRGQTVTRSVIGREAFAFFPQSELDEIRVVRVKSAIYGIPGKTADVTEALNKLVAGGASSFEVRNTVVGIDPAYGTQKELKVTYFNGRCELVTKTVPEKTTFQF